MTRFKHPQEVWTWLGSGTKLADLFLQVRINGDVALLKGIMKEVLDAEERQPGQVLDHDFITQYTTGFEEFRQALRQRSAQTTSSNNQASRRSRSKKPRAIFLESERVIFCWAMGLTQHKNAVGNIQEIVNLMLLRGQMGKPGAGLCPVRGHSNVQGDRTMGIWEQPTDAVSRQAWRRNSISSRRDVTAWTLCMRFRRCTTHRLKSSSRWAEIFSPRRRTRNSRLKPCAAVV